MAEISDGLNGFYGNSTVHQPAIIVRAEEALIVTLVLVLWIAAIALFFNRWGKIRMLEPYQPKFTQQNRTSCHLVDQATKQHRSFSKFNLNGETSVNHQMTIRPRQNSVFVGSSVMTLPMNRVPRKVKSAFDLQYLVVSEPALHKGNAPGGGGSPFKLTLPSKKTTFDGSSNENAHPNRERRLSFRDLIEIDSSVKVEKAHCRGKEKDFIARMGKSGENPLKLHRNSQAENRRNSVALVDVKPFLAPSSRHSTCDRRYSLLPGSRNEGLLLKSELIPGVVDFRRNSALLSFSVENDRSFWPTSRDTLKSGVVDFRRNSTLILNNLNEDIGYRYSGRNFSLGGLNKALAPDFLPSTRRDSSIPAFGYEYKQRGFFAKGKAPRINVFCGADENASKLLDPSDSTKIPERQGTKRDSARSLGVSGESKQLLPLVPARQSFAGSCASLDAYSTRSAIGSMGESRSSDLIAKTSADIVPSEVPEEASGGAADLCPVPTLNVSPNLTNPAPTLE